MKKWTVTTGAIALHLILAAALYSATTNPEYTAPPQDVLLKAATFDNAQFAIYKAGAECVIDGKPYKIEGDGAETLPLQFECVESPTGNFIQIGMGWARARIEGVEYNFLTP